VKGLAATAQKAIAATGTLTGRKFALLVASSLVATTGIVAAALNGSGGLGPLAEAAARQLLARSPRVLTSTPTPTPAPPPSSSPKPAPSAGAASSGHSPAAASPAPQASSTPEPEEPVPVVHEDEGPEAGPIKHVFVVSLASHGYEAAFGPTPAMPYLAGSLRPQGTLLTNYSLLDPASLPNSIAAVSGQAPSEATRADCPDYDACVFPVETLSLADQLVSAQLSWSAYLEGMADETGQPSNCVHPDPGVPEIAVAGGYAARLNPFVFFHSLLDLGDCATNDVPFTELAKDLKKLDATPNFAFIAPNLCDAGFRGQCPVGTADGPAAADAFLSRVVPAILASPAYKRDGLLIVGFGAVDTAPPLDPANPAEAPSAEPLRSGALLISRFLRPGGTDSAPYNPYSLLRSTEDLFGLDRLAGAGGMRVRSFAARILAANAGD
jgi:Phosphoesterase family